MSFEEQYSADDCAGCREYEQERIRLTERLAVSESALTEANRRLAEITQELYGHGYQVAGWHLNHDLEPLDSWFEDNEWGPVEAKGVAE